MRLSTRKLALIAATCATLFAAFVVVLLLLYFPPPMEPIDIPSVGRA